MLVCQGRAAPVLKIAWLREEKKRKKKCGSGNEEQNELVESLGKTEIKKKYVRFLLLFCGYYIYIYIMQEEKKGKKKERWRKFYLTTQLLTKAVVWGEREVA